MLLVRGGVSPVCVSSPGLLFQSLLRVLILENQTHVSRTTTGGVSPSATHHRGYPLWANVGPVVRGGAGGKGGGRVKGEEPDET